jgi:hypothetical protein
LLQNEHSFSLKEEKWQKSLHNIKVGRVLGIVAASEQLLTSAQIKKKMNVFYPGTSNRDIYEIINKLCPISDRPTSGLLFCWPDFSKRQANKFVQKIKELIPPCYFQWKGDTYLNVEPKQTDAITEATIQDSELDQKRNRVKLEIQRDAGQIHVSITSKGRTWTLPTITKKRYGRLLVYSYQPESNRRTRYLDIEFTPQAEKFRAKKLAQTNGELTEVHKAIQTNKRFFGYKPNLRGILLYFYILSMHPPKTGPDKKLLDNGLSNPALVNVAPFLKNIRTFKQYGLPILDILTEISIQLKPQIDTEDQVELEYYCTKKYLDSINRQFDDFESTPCESINKFVNVYRLNALHRLKEITKKRLEELSETISSLSHGI